MVLAYEIPLGSGNNKIDKKVLNDVATLLLLVEDDKDALKISNLNELEPVEIDNRSYKRWSGNNLTSGSSYSINIKRNIIFKEYIDLYPIIIFAVMFLSVFILSLISRTENKDKNNINSLKSGRDDILRQIIELDDEYENKQIEESAYLDIRARLKNKIAEIDKIIKDHQNGTE